jgi:hypothetical protein
MDEDEEKNGKVAIKSLRRKKNEKYEVGEEN